MISISLTTTGLGLVTGKVSLPGLCGFLVGFGAGLCAARCECGNLLVPGSRRGPWGAGEIPRSGRGSGVGESPLGSARYARSGGRLFRVVLPEGVFICHFDRSVTSYEQILRASEGDDVSDEDERVGREIPGNRKVQVY